MGVSLALMRDMFFFHVNHHSQPLLVCRECDDAIIAKNPVQVKQWAERHVRTCPALEEMSDLAEIGMSDEHADWYAEKEILSDE